MSEHQQATWIYRWLIYIYIYEKSPPRFMKPIALTFKIPVYNCTHQNLTFGEAPLSRYSSWKFAFQFFNISSELSCILLLHCQIFYFKFLFIYLLSFLRSLNSLIFFCKHINLNICLKYFNELKIFTRPLDNSFYTNL